MSHFKSILLTALLGASACAPAWAAETKPLTIIIDRIGADGTPARDKTHRLLPIHRSLLEANPTWSQNPGYQGL